MSKIQFAQNRQEPDDSDDMGVDVDHSKEVVIDNTDQVKTGVPDIIPTSVNTPPATEVKSDDLQKVIIAGEDGKDQELFINANGDAVNEKGEVIYTKDKLESDDEVTPFDILDEPDIPIIDEAGKLKNYNKDPKGLSEYIKDVYQQAAKDTLKDNNEEVFYNKLFSDYPVIKDVLDHVKKTGSVQGFDFEVDITAKLEKDKLNPLRSIIRKDRLNKGETPEEAEAYITYLEGQDKLFESAVSVQDRMVKTKKQQVQNEAIQQAVNFENYWGISAKDNTPISVDNSVYDIVNNKKEIVIDGQTLNIPEVIKVKTGEASFTTKSRQDFFRFLFDVKPYKIGNQVQNMTEYAYRTYIKEAKREPNRIHYDVYDALKEFIGEDPLLNVDSTRNNYIDAQKRMKVTSSPGSSSSSIKQIKFLKKRQN